MFRHWIFWLAIVPSIGCLCGCGGSLVHVDKVENKVYLDGEYKAIEMKQSEEGRK